MLYTITDSFCLFSVDDLTNEINARPHLRDAFNFSEIFPWHLNNYRRGNAELNVRKVGYFIDKSTCNLIVEFVGLHTKMYSFTVCDASEPIPGVNYPIDMRYKAVTKALRAP